MPKKIIIFFFWRGGSFLLSFLPLCFWEALFGGSIQGGATNLECSEPFHWEQLIPLR